MGSCSSRQQKSNVASRSLMPCSDDGDHSQTSSSDSSATQSQPLSKPTEENDDPVTVPIAVLSPLQDSSRKGSARLACRLSNRQSDDGNDQIVSFDQRYQIQSQVLLGSGITGQVRQCIHRPSSQLCAVKTIDKSRILGGRDRIRCEVEFLKQVRHPNIIRLYDVYEDEQEVRIVTELCRGGELFDRIVEKAKSSKKKRSEEESGGDGSSNQQNGAFPACFHEETAVQIVRSLLSAVSYLHSNNIVHRDIKPENVMFQDKDDDDESSIKLIDFGLSVRHAPGDAPLRRGVGTPYYMAPEVLDGRYDRSCDLWSVGVIAYAMLMGRPPFNGTTDEAIFEKIRQGRYRMDDGTFVGGTSAAAKDFIQKLLESDPKKRWTADMALEHPWVSALKIDN